MASGAAAAVAATLMTQPADIVRTHMQLGLAKGAARRGAIATFRDVVSQGGPRILLAGAPPRVGACLSELALSCCNNSQG